MTESHCKILGRPQATCSASARATMVSSKSLTPHLEGGTLGEVSKAPVSSTCTHFHTTDTHPGSAHAAHAFSIRSEQDKSLPSWVCILVAREAATSTNTAKKQILQRAGSDQAGRKREEGRPGTGGSSHRSWCH